MLYAIPSISAIAIKLVFLWRAKRSLLLTNHAFLAAFISLLSFNICELALFTLKTGSEGALAIVSAYYITGICSILSILGVTLHVTQKAFPTKWLLATGAAISCFIAMPGLVIEGTQSIGYSFTRVPGPFYILIQIALIVPAILTIGLLGYHAIKSKSATTKTKSTVLLICLTPSFLCLLGVIALMQFGVHINATVIISFTINIFLFGLLFLEGKYHIYGLLSAVPGTRYNDSARALTQALFDPNLSLEKAKELMDMEKTRYTLKLTNGNQSEAARMLGVSRPTICRRIKLLEEFSASKNG